MLASVVGDHAGSRKKARVGGLREQRVVSEAYPESEFNLNPGAASAGVCVYGCELDPKGGK